MSPSPADDRRVVCILGIDTVRGKLLYQTRWLADQGWRVDVLTMHRNVGSHEDDASARIVGLPSSPIGRAKQALSYLRERRGELHHVELYIGGRFAFVYALLCRALRIPLLVVERGDLLMCQRRVYPLSARLSIYACYRLANAVWYKEPYMGRALEAWHVRPAFLLPNAVPMPAATSSIKRDVDLLWVNRLIPERHPDWFADAVVALTTKRALRATVLGFSQDESELERVTALEAEVRARLATVPGATCLPFGDPVTHYPRARWFVLPGDVVFGNFALLEAMSHGVVPVVSGTESVDLLIEDGRNGLVARHDAAGLQTALEQALGTSDTDWQRMSEAARKTVEEQYSLDSWGRRLLGGYARLRS